MIEEMIEKKLAEFSSAYAKQTSNCSSTGRQVAFAYCAICWGLLIKGEINSIETRLLFISLAFCILFIFLDFMQSFLLSKRYNTIYIETIKLLKIVKYPEKINVLTDATNCQSEANHTSGKIFFYKFIFIVLATFTLLGFLVLKI